MVQIFTFYLYNFGPSWLEMLQNPKMIQIFFWKLKTSERRPSWPNFDFFNKINGHISPRTGLVREKMWRLLLDSSLQSRVPPKCSAKMMKQQILKLEQNKHHFIILTFCADSKSGFKLELRQREVVKLFNWKNLLRGTKTKIWTNAPKGSQEVSIWSLNHFLLITIAKCALETFWTDLALLG